MIASVTIIFGVSWLPIHSIYFAYRFSKNFPSDSDFLYLLKHIAHTLTYLNSMLNPFFYSIISDSFRLSFNFKMSRYSTNLKLSNNNFNLSSVKLRPSNGSMYRQNNSYYRYKMYNSKYKN